MRSSMAKKTQASTPRFRVKMGEAMFETILAAAALAIVGAALFGHVPIVRDPVAGRELGMH
jgi:hypothetical protein